MAARHAVLMLFTFVSEAKEKEFFETIYPSLIEYVKRNVKGFQGFELTKVLGKERTYMSVTLWDNEKAANVWVEDPLHMKLRERAKAELVCYDLVTRWNETGKCLEWSKCPVCQKISYPPMERCECGFSLSHVSLKTFEV